MLRRFGVFGLMALFAWLLAAGASATPSLDWRGWSKDALDRAQAEKRFVILDLEAVWCHWCHVMEQTTYSDPKVVELLKSHYITIRVDQDANPDLSARYGDWGWPATIIFSPDGAELVKRRGYIPPENMLSLLQAVIDDPTPGPSVIAKDEASPSEASQIDAPSAEILSKAFADAYDAENGGWGRVHKYIDPDSMDWALYRAERGDADAARMARKTIGAATALIDPVWGGIYQYSDELDWSSPHFEKIILYQANGLRQYAVAGELFKQPGFLRAADDIYRYLKDRLLAPGGAFFATQDADVDRELTGKSFYGLNADERERLGKVPRIDPNLYARENGWAVKALVAYANATGAAEPLDLARRAAEWLLAERLRSDGLFNHGAEDRGGPFLGDQIAVGDAMIDLYAATGERRWLQIAQACAASLKKFRDAAGGYSTSLTGESDRGALAMAHTAPDEQVQAARFAIRAWRYFGDGEAKAAAEHAMRYLASATLIESGRFAPGTLLANAEFSNEPTHITVVGAKGDAEAMRLHEAARRYPATNKRIDWWDMSEGALPNPDVTYPELDRAAAFACSNRICSLPAFSADELAAAVARMGKLGEQSEVR